jgi:hypothetical protein
MYFDDRTERRPKSYGTIHSAHRRLIVKDLTTRRRHAATDFIDGSGVARFQSNRANAYAIRWNKNDFAEALIAGKRNVLVTSLSYLQTDDGGQIVGRLIELWRRHDDVAHLPNQTVHR